MKVRSLVALGYMSVMAAIGLGTAPGSVAAETNHTGLVEERVGHGGSIYYSNQTTAMRSNSCAAAQGDLVEERIGHGGSILRSKATGDCALLAEDRTKGPLVEERVGHGGSVYVRPAARQTVN